jgi:hypothetical protein
MVNFGGRNYLIYGGRDRKSFAQLLGEGEKEQASEGKKRKSE